MGLFCQMFHVLDVDQSKVQDGLNAVLSKRGFSLNSATSIDGTQLDLQVDTSVAPAYILGPKLGRWTPLIDLYSEPWPGEICTELSEACSSYTICIMVHDDDVMFYNLDYNGKSLDGYNSNPQFFENERVSESEVQSQRHTPEPFEDILPEGKKLKDLLNILNAGWWQAHDDGNLDDDGVMIDEIWDTCPYQLEGERMVALGSFLGLAGQAGYPFADWRENKMIEWQDYRLLQFEKKAGMLKRLFGKKT